MQRDCIAQLNAFNFRQCELTDENIISEARTNRPTGIKREIINIIDTVG